MTIYENGMNTNLPYSTEPDVMGPINIIGGNWHHKQTIFWLHFKCWQVTNNAINGSRKCWSPTTGTRDFNNIKFSS